MLFTLIKKEIVNHVLSLRFMITFVLFFGHPSKKGQSS